MDLIRNDHELGVNLLSFVVHNFLLSKLIDHEPNMNDDAFIQSQRTKFTTSDSCTYNVSLEQTEVLERIQTQNPSVTRVLRILE